MLFLVAGGVHVKGASQILSDATRSLQLFTGELSLDGKTLFCFCRECDDLEEF